jgi:hypothetical protein
MHRFLYTAWFRNLTLPTTDQDYEWPACFVVEAPTSAEAQAWADHLARAYATRRQTEEFLWSDIERATGTDDASLPVVPVGREPTDAEIGW